MGESLLTPPRQELGSAQNKGEESQVCWAGCLEEVSHSTTQDGALLGARQGGVRKWTRSRGAEGLGWVGEPLREAQQGGKATWTGRRATVPAGQLCMSGEAEAVMWLDATVEEAGLRHRTADTVLPHGLPGHRGSEDMRVGAGQASRSLCCF